VEQLPGDPLPPPRFVGTSERPAVGRSPLRDPRVELAVVLAAVLGRLPSLGAWWNGEDWILLGRAAGLVERTGEGWLPARWLSGELFWEMSYPLFGLASYPYTAVRLLLLAGCAWLVVRLAARAGLNPLQQLVAGLILAGTPLAFAPLYQAAGVQELLGLCLALAAVERWLAAGQGNIFWAAGLALLSLLSHELGLGLPVLFLVLARVGVGAGARQGRTALVCSLVLLAAALGEGYLVLKIALSGGESTAGNAFLSALTGFPANLGKAGWWLFSPGPMLARILHWPMAAAGLAVFAGWAWWGVVGWQAGRRLPGTTLLGALLALAPSLVLGREMGPAHVLPAVAAAGLAVAFLVGWSRQPALWLIAAATILTAGWSYLSMEVRLGQRDSLGLPADPLVRATSLSWQNTRAMTGLPLQRGQLSGPALTIIQIPSSAADARLAYSQGPLWVNPSPLYQVLGGNVGPRLVLSHHHGTAVDVQWVNALISNPPDALVLCEDGLEFRHWGNTANATFFAALEDVGRHRFERARLHLLRGSRLQGGGGQEQTAASFFFDPGQLTISLDRVLANKEAFIDWTAGLLAEQHSVLEVGGLQDMFLQLLVAATGQSLEELTAGSHPLSSEPVPAGPAPATGD
jgi:hypothetical protein